jgi:hypothetical protein
MVKYFSLWFSFISLLSVFGHCLDMVLWCISYSHTVLEELYGKGFLLMIAFVVCEYYICLACIIGTFFLWSECSFLLEVYFAPTFEVLLSGNINCREYLVEAPYPSVFLV